MRSLLLAAVAIFLSMLAVNSAVCQDLPKPKVGFVRVEDAVNNGHPVRLYEIEVINRSEYVDETFAPSPDLPPCGRNANSSRTWINIYSESGKRLYGFCAIKADDELSSLKFYLPADAKQPAKIYIDFVDRRANKVLRSNKVEVSQ